jgi:hypothetical protein
MRTRLDHETRKNTYDDVLCNELWMIIFRFALNGQISDFNQTWCSIRLVSKKWNDLVAINHLVPFRDPALTRHAFLLSIRFDQQTWIRTFIERKLIEPTMDDSIAVYETIRWDKGHAFNELVSYMDWRNHQFRKYAMQSGAVNVLLEMIKLNQSLHYYGLSNMLTKLLKNGHYDACMKIIRYCNEQKDSIPKLYKALCVAMSYQDFLRTCCKRGYTRLFKTAIAIRIPSRDRRSYDRDTIALVKNCFDDAIKHAHIDTVRFILSEFSKILTGLEISYGIYICTTFDYVDIMKVLLAHDPSNTRDDTYLSNAASHGSLKSITVLLNQSDIVISEQIISNAAINNHRAVVKYLIDASLQKKSTEPINYSNIIDDTSRFAQLVLDLLRDSRLDHSRVDINKILTRACVSVNDTHIIDELITQFNADPNSEDCLIEACKHANVVIINYLVHHPKIVKQTITRAIIYVIKYIDEPYLLDVLLSSPLISKDDYPSLIVTSVSKIPCQCVFSLLQHLWQDNENVPPHWRFFYLMHHMTYCNDDLCDVYSVATNQSPYRILLHLKICHMLHGDTICRICENLRFSDGENEFTLKSVIRSIMSDLSYTNPPKQLLSFMNYELYHSVKSVFYHLCNMVK